MTNMTIYHFIITGKITFLEYKRFPISQMYKIKIYTQHVTIQRVNFYKHFPFKFMSFMLLHLTSELDNRYKTFEN